MQQEVMSQKKQGGTDMFKRLIISGLTVIGSVSFLGMAQAADLPVKSSPYIAPAPVWSWTGFYIGGHVGGGWGTTSSTLNSLGTPFPLPPGFGTGALSNLSSSGILGGVQLGYNYQISPLFVLGVEGDFSWADINGDGPCSVQLPFFIPVAFSCGGTANWIGDITGRVGLAHDRLLVYLKGGWAWSDNDYNVSGTIPIGPGVSVNGSASSTRSGGLLGFGIEYAFTQNWTAKIEYNYIDFGTDTITVPTSVTGLGGGLNLSPSVAIDERINLVKVGVNYKF